MDIAAGEYGYDIHYFDRMLAAGGRRSAGRRHALHRDYRVPQAGCDL